MCLNISDIAVITAKGFDCYCILFDVSKFEPIHLLKNSLFDHPRYM